MDGWVEQRKKGKTEKVSDCCMHSWMDERHPVRKKERITGCSWGRGGILAILTSFFLPFYTYLDCAWEGKLCESVCVCYVYVKVFVCCVCERVFISVCYMCVSVHECV